MTPHPQLIKRTRTQQHPLPVSEVKILHQVQYHRVTSFVPVSNLRHRSLLRVVRSLAPTSNTSTRAPAPAQQCNKARGVPSPSIHVTGHRQLQHQQPCARNSPGAKVTPAWTRWTNTVMGPRRRLRLWEGPAAGACLQIIPGGRWEVQTPRFLSG